MIASGMSCDDDDQSLTRAALSTFHLSLLHLLIFSIDIKFYSLRF